MFVQGQPQRGEPFDVDPCPFLEQLCLPADRPRRRIEGVAPAAIRASIDQTIGGDWLCVDRKFGCEGGGPERRSAGGGKRMELVVAQDRVDRVACDGGGG